MDAPGASSDLGGATPSCVAAPAMHSISITHLSRLPRLRTLGMTETEKKRICCCGYHLGASSGVKRWHGGEAKIEAHVLVLERCCEQRPDSALCRGANGGVASLCMSPVSEFRMACCIIGQAHIASLWGEGEGEALPLLLAQTPPCLLRAGLFAICGFHHRVRGVPCWVQGGGGAVVCHLRIRGPWFL